MKIEVEVDIDAIVASCQKEANAATTKAKIKYEIQAIIFTAIKKEVNKKLKVPNIRKLIEEEVEAFDFNARIKAAIKDKLQHECSSSEYY